MKKDKRIDFRLDSELYALIKEVADKERREPGEMVREICFRWFHGGQQSSEGEMPQPHAQNKIEESCMRWIRDIKNKKLVLGALMGIWTAENEDNASRLEPTKKKIHSKDRN